MAGLPLKDRFKDRGALELHRVGLISRRGGDVEFYRVENLSLIVTWIRLRHCLHRFEIRKYAGAMIDFVVIGIEGGHRIDEIALALRLGADRLALLDRRKPKREVPHWRRGVRVIEKAQRDPPIGNAAVGIRLEYLLEQLLRLSIPERMLVAHGSIEAALRHLVA